MVYKNEPLPLTKNTPVLKGLLPLMQNLKMRNFRNGFDIYIV